MFNSFSTYASEVKTVNQQEIQNDETHISINDFSFGSSSGIASLGTTSGQTSTSISAETKIAYSQGLWWLFYSNSITGAGRDVFYQTSPDGTTWSAATSVTTTGNAASGAGYGYDFSIYQDGSTIYYVLVFGTHFYWRYGVMQSTGAITWTIAQTAIATTHAISEYDSIVTDYQGNTWVAVNTVAAGVEYIEVWEHAAGAGNGAWTQENIISGVATDAVPLLLNTPSGVVLIYGAGGSTGAIYITSTTSANPTVWSTAVSPTLNYAMANSSAVEIGNTVYFAGLGASGAGATTGTVDFFTYNNGAASTSGTEVISSTVASWQVVMSDASNTLQVFYGAGTNLYQLFSTNYGQSFSSAKTVSTGQAALSGLTSIYSGDAVAWISGTPTFNLEFYSLSTTSVTSASPLVVHLISLYIYDTTSGTLFHYDVNSSAQGVVGSFSYWVPPEQSITIPNNFTWTGSDSFTITITTDQGIVASYSLTAPA